LDWFFWGLDLLGVQDWIAGWAGLASRWEEKGELVGKGELVVYIGLGGIRPGCEGRVRSLVYR